MKVCSNGPGHMIKMAAMPIYGKNPLKIFFSRTRRRMECQIVWIQIRTVSVLIWVQNVRKGYQQKTSRGQHGKWSCSCRDFFWCPQGPKFGPFPNGIQVTFFPNLKKKSQPQKKKKKKKIFFFFRIFIQSPHTHTHTLTSYMMTIF